MSFQKNYEKLMDEMLGLEIIDTHEHLMQESERLALTPDFSTMFAHYCKGDLLAAGMTRAQLDTFYSEKTPVDEKWAMFEPYYQVIQDGSYARAAHIAMEKFYDMSRLNSLADAEELTGKIRKANKKGLYKKVLKDTCNIRISLNYGISTEQDPAYFAPVIFATDHTHPNRDFIRGIEAQVGVSCGNLNNYVSAIWEQFRQLKEQGMKGIKFHSAYMRDLNFAATTHAQAEEVFLRITEEGYGWRNSHLGYRESKPLQDYLVHRFCEIAEELDVPIIFHTGLQGDIDHNPDDSRPLRMWNLPHRYRNIDFVLLHAGLPWLEDAGLMAKQYSNVYLDLAWSQLMSPEITTRALKAWMDLVPMNKIFAFGGDYFVVEKVYGHLMIARQNIARALADKMETAGMPFDRAKAWLQAMFWDNPKRVFKLEI
ncbi:MAG: amidohydrolase family protein [Armatimonadota bacterium]|nr:amidohydrolase family protein [Armatimonadota bacterium]